jgi:protein-L-isoaspartate O-methyltransferase
MVKHLYRRGEFENYAQVEMSKAEYSKFDTDYKGTATIENSHRVRLICSHKMGRKVVFLTDSKVHEKPGPVEKQTPVVPDVLSFESTSYQKPERSEFDDIKDTLKAGIKAVVADQLFVTPPDLAEKVIDYADLEPGICVLEPSGGTGNLIDAVLKRVDTEVVTYEINGELCSLLRDKFPSHKVRVYCNDFLESGNPFRYDRIVMNPPFKNGDDIKHIKKALEMLAPGGKLVAICANGPKQREQLMSIATHWEDLPEGIFKSSGTMVNAALLVIDK